MRVKISTSPPLPPVRAWFPLSPPSAQGHASTPTISSFKSLLCASLPAFRSVSPSSLRLSIDDFELFDNSELAIVRDGDLICIDVLDVPPEDTTVSLGRAVDQGASRALQTRLEPAALRKRKRRMSTPSSSGSESDTESTTSTSGSESRLETETETSDSESTSDSDSGDSSCPMTPSLRKAGPPKINARERPQVTPSVQPKPHVVHDNPIFVPPGYGKPQTRSRNLRRRLKRMYEREAADTSEGRPVSGANAAVPGEKAITPQVPDASQEVYAIPALMSLSLRNKNKAKNFKSLIGRPLPPKIIFGDQDDDGSVSTSGVMATPECPTPAVGMSKSQTPSTQAVARLIPPSSRSSLPSNLFVTSIDVEAGLHRQKKKRKMRVEYGDELEGSSEVVSGESGENISLDYGDGIEAGEKTAPAPELEVDIYRLESIADKHWVTLEKPTSEKQVTPGMIVGYKALGINPETYTPEQLLTLGRVLSCDGDSVVVRPLRVREQVSFSGPVDDDTAEAAAEGHTWEEISHGDWRILKV